MEKKRKISTEPIHPELTTRIKELGDFELDNNVLVELPSNEKVENWLRTSFPLGSTNAVENYLTFINPESESPHTSLMGKSINNGGIVGGIVGGIGAAAAAAIDEDSSVDTTKYIKSNQTRTRRKRSIKQHCFLSSTTAAAAAAAAKSGAITSNGKLLNQNNISRSNGVGRKPPIKQNGRTGGDGSQTPVMEKMKKCSVDLLKSPKLSNINCRTGANNNNGAAINGNGGDDKLSKNIYSVWYIKKKRRTRPKTTTLKVNNQTIKNGNGGGGGILRGRGGGGSLSSSSCENKHFDTRRLVEQRFSGRLAKKRKNAEKINGNGGGNIGGGGDGGGIDDIVDDINRNCKSNPKCLRSTRRKRNLNDEIAKNIFRSGL